jgi:GalNAc-alpha-(1->4)-GalNAc-alpha-(1->3)-diNAcBac-PP-undecaprenol alpha-1,4-N-acetyl-D-galactosaminyltransferase
MRLMFAARMIDRMAGGVERMIITIMNAMVARGHEVDLFTWDLRGAEAFYPMAPDITWHRLDMGSPSVKASTKLMWGRARTIRSLVCQRRPQVIVSFQDGPFLALRAYTMGLGIPVVAAERNAPTRFDHTSAGRHQRLIFQGLRLATRIAIQCESYRALYPVFLRERICCVPNPVLPALLLARPDTRNSDGRFRLLSVGRLCYQKNYSVLIEAFAQLAPAFPDWDLVVVGEGEDRGSLESLVAERGLERRVMLAGVSTSIAKWYASAQLFCLPSLWEGFPNALAEAFAHGLPAVGFANCAGVRDLIVHGSNGLLADGNGDAASLTGALTALMSDSALRASMGLAAADSVRQFNPENIFSRWEQLFSEIAANEAPFLH